MIDLKFIRENPDPFRQAMLKRGKDFDPAELLHLDQQRRLLLTESEKLKARRNELSGEIAALRREKKCLSHQYKPPNRSRRLTPVSVYGYEYQCSEMIRLSLFRLTYANPTYLAERLEGACCGHL